jgi:ribosomal protein S7
MNFGIQSFTNMLLGLGKKKIAVVIIYEAVCEHV